MDFGNRRALKEEAGRLLRRAREPQKLILAYCIAAGVLSLLLTGSSYALEHMISNSGGLGNLGSRAILSTVQSMLPYGEFFISIGLNLGLLSGILRFSRLQYADHTDLVTGFRLFFPALRLTLLQLGLYILIGFAAVLLASQIFMLSPWALPFMEAAASVSAGTLTDAVPVIDDTTMETLSRALVPMLVIFAVLYLGAMLFVSYRYRMAHYCLLDDPNHRALPAMRESRTMLRGKLLALFKLDLSFWWYYLLLLAVTVLGYGEVFLPLLGITLPLSDTAAFFLFYAVMLAGQLLVYYFFRIRMDTTYAVFYNTIRPKPQEEGVLGNIFDL